MKITFILSVAILFCSCATLKKLPDSNLQSGYYKLHQPNTKHSKVYLDVVEDSLNIISTDSDSNTKPPIVPVNGQTFLKESFDIDVMTVPFKFRPATQNLPRQLTVDFNGNIFLGYRFDQYKVVFTETPAGLVKKVRHRAITFGAFGGMGTSSITPGTTNNGTTDEYNGFILNRGISIMGGVNNLTVGLGIGWDYLTDRDKDTWIYQNEPWYGLTLSLNLN
jgi:hypothetical protein